MKDHSAGRQGRRPSAPTGGKAKAQRLRPILLSSPAQPFGCRFCRLTIRPTVEVWTVESAGLGRDLPFERLGPTFVAADRRNPAQWGKPMVSTACLGS